MFDRAFRYGRSSKVHAAREIFGFTLPEPTHVRTLCGLSGSPTNAQFRIVETSGPITCRICLRALGKEST